MCKSKQDWLLRLRRCSEKDTLEKVVELTSRKLTGNDLLGFYLAADHRRAEITMGVLYDKVPASAWKYVD